VHHHTATHTSQNHPYSAPGAAQSSTASPANQRLTTGKIPLLQLPQQSDGADTSGHCSLVPVFQSDRKVQNRKIGGKQTAENKLETDTAAKIAGCRESKSSSLMGT